MVIMLAVTARAMAILVALMVMTVMASSKVMVVMVRTVTAMGVRGRETNLGALHWFVCLVQSSKVPT